MGLLNQRVQPIVFDDSQFNQLLGLGVSAMNMPLLNKRAQPVLLEATQYAQLLAAMGGLLSVETDIVASTTQTQAGATQLSTKDVSVITVCNNADDSIRLPPAATGRSIIIINISLVESALIWPYPGDDIGFAGVDQSSGHASSPPAYLIAVDDTNWVRMPAT